MGESQHEIPENTNEKPESGNISDPNIGLRSEDLEIIPEDSGKNNGDESLGGESQQTDGTTNYSDKQIDTQANPEIVQGEKVVQGEKEYHQPETNYTVTANAPGSIAINAINSPITIDYRSMEKALKEDGSKRKSDDVDTLLFSQLEEKDLFKSEYVFVAPENYGKSLEILFKESNERIFFVHGPENSGKYITAVNIGLDIIQHQNIAERKIYSHVSKNINIPNLVAFLETSENQKQCIYIIRDVFEHGLSISDFSDMAMSVLNKFLRVNNNYLILTTTKTRGDLENVKSHIVSSFVSEDRLLECFMKHLKYGEMKESLRPVPANIVLLINTINEIDSGFKNPNQVDYFFDQISRDELQIATANVNEIDSKDRVGENENNLRLTEALQRLAQRARRYGFPSHESTRLWFEGLHENIKLFALLAIILKGFKFSLIEEIYEKAVKHLIDEVGSIEHQSIFGRNKILSEIRAKIEDDGFLVFDSQVYVLEIIRQIDNRHLLLWPLVNLFVDYIYRFKERELWEGRRELGAAIGRIGVYGYGKLDTILDELAGHEESGVVVSAGYALAEICNLDSKHYPYVINVMKRWIDSGDPDLMWAAGASIWRVYDALMRIVKNEQPDSILFQKTNAAVQSVHDCLTELASRVDEFSEEIRYGVAIKLLQVVAEAETRNPNLKISIKEAKQIEQQLTSWVINNIGSVLHAIRQMLWLNPDEIVDLIQKWINADQTNKSRSANLNSLGLLSSNELFKKAKDTQKQRFYGLNIPLMNITQSILSRGDEDSVELMMDAYCNWMLEPGLGEQVKNQIIPIINRLNAPELHWLRSGIINGWLESNVDYAHRLGKALINRSYMVQGAPFGLRTNEPALLLWDTSLAGRKDHVDKVARNLYIRINARQNVDLYSLGRTQKVLFSGTYPSVEEMQLISGHTPVMYPIVNKEMVRLFNSVITIVYDQILDIEDLEIDFIKEKCLFVRLKGILQEPISDIPVSRWIEREDYLALEQFLDELISSNLLQVDEEYLWDQIKPFAENDKSIINITRLLNDQLGLLDAPSSIQFNETKIDLAQIISLTIIWLLRQDLSSCLDLLKSWILDNPSDTSPQHSLQRKIGIGGGRLVVNVLAQSQKIPPTKMPKLLNFVELLVKQDDWESQRIALSAIINWAFSEENFRTILQANLLDIFVEYVPQGNFSDLLGLTEKWLQNKELSSYQKRIAKIIKTKALLGQKIGTKNLTDFDKRVIRSIQKGDELPSDQRYSLILINESNLDENHADIAVETCRSLSKNTDYYPIVCRIGEKMPIAIGTQEISHDNLFRQQKYELPQVIGPFLDNLHPEQFPFIIVFGSSDFYDKDDWYEDWNKFFWFQYPLVDKSIVGWPPLIEEKSISENNLRAKQIIKYISDRVKKGT